MTGQEPIDLQSLHQAVLAQSKLLGQMLAHAREDDEPMVLSPDQGYELLDICLGDLPAAVRARYFQDVDRYYPKHSTEG